MSTGKDYGLPAEYADWVEVPSINSVGVKSDYILIEVLRYSNGPLERAERVHQRRFVPPKPKPTLPEVGVGGVIRYVSNSGWITRAVRQEEDWECWTTHPGRSEPPQHHSTWTAREMLTDVNDDGFVVELDGLG